MPEWMVRVGGPERDLRFLLERLRDPACRVTEDGSEFYLRSSLFEALGGAGEVKQIADGMIERANLAALLDCERYRGVHTGGVMRVDPDGSRHMTITVSDRITIGAADGLRAGEAVIAGSITVIGSQPAPPTDLYRGMAPLKEQPALADALSYVRNEPNWNGYYKAYEAARDANGGDRGLRRKGWTTKPALSRFTYSAQPDRHHNCPGPDNRMSEAEGRAYVLDLLRKWRDEELSRCA